MIFGARNNFHHVIKNLLSNRISITRPTKRILICFKNHGIYLMITPLVIRSHIKKMKYIPKRKIENIKLVRKSFTNYIIINDSIFTKWNSLDKNSLKIKHIKRLIKKYHFSKKF